MIIVILVVLCQTWRLARVEVALGWIEIETVVRARSLVTHRDSTDGLYVVPLWLGVIAISSIAALWIFLVRTAEHHTARTTASISVARRGLRPRPADLCSCWGLGVGQENVQGLGAQSADNAVGHNVCWGWGGRNRPGQGRGASGWQRGVHRAGVAFEASALTAASRG